MKRFIIIVMAALCVATAGIIIHLNRQKGLPAAAPTVASLPEQKEAAPAEQIVAAEQEKPRAVSAEARITKPVSTAPVPTEARSDDSAKTAAFGRAIEVLVSPQ